MSDSPHEAPIFIGFLSLPVEIQRACEELAASEAVDAERRRTPSPSRDGVVIPPEPER
jgi:hypothetical protein